MAKRDVELVIRARDQARKAIDGVSDALRDLTSQQNQVADSARRTDGLLGSLGEEFRRLGSEVQALGALGKVSAQLDRAANSVARLETQFGDSANEVARLQNELNQLEQNLISLRSTSDQAKDSLASQERVLRDLTKEQRTLDSTVAALKNGYSSLLQEFRRAKEPSEALRQSIRQQGIALQNALGDQDNLTAAIRRQTTAVTAAKGAYEGAQAAIRTAEGGQRRIAAAAENASAALQEQELALQNARNEFLEIRRVADTASTALGGVAVNQRELAEASRQAAQDLRRVETELRRQAAAPAAQPQATNQGAASTATQAYRDQVQALERLRQEWTEAQSRVQQLAVQMRNTAQPTQALRTEFLLAQAAARQAKDGFLEQRLELENLRRGIAVTKAVAEGFAPVFTQIANEQNRAGDSARLASNSFQTFLQRLLGIDRAAIEAGQAMRFLDQQTRKTAAGVGTWGEETRKALSLGQRLRGEVLSLVTAYVGLFQAINQIGSVVTAFRVAEAASNRLGVVFKQDTRLVGQELQFLTAQADRLGLGFNVLADEYSKFAIAASSAGLSIGDTRDAFLAIAEASRVNKLDLEQLSGVYLAFTQILSKGKFTSEEVRRQLGDRLPGAFNILADAIGVTGAELDRLLAAGELRADADTLLKFTDELRRRFGPQLSTSINSTTAELDRFKNTIFQAQLTIGRGGFIEALTETVRELNASFQTAEAREFFLAIGSLLGNGVRLLGVFVQNLETIIRIAQVGVSILVGKFLLGAIQGLAQVNTLSAATVISINRATTSFAALGAAIRATAIGAFSTSISALRGSFAGLNGQLTFAAVRANLTAVALTTLRVAATAAATAARTLWAAIGGFPGLILAGATFLITELFGTLTTAVPDATLSLEEHERQVIAVSKAYQQAQTDGVAFAGVVEDVSLAQADRVLRELEGAFADAFDEATDSAESLRNRLQLLYNREGQDAFTRATIESLNGIVQEFQAGTLSAREATEAVNALYGDIRNDEVKAAAQDFAALSFELFQADERAGRQAVIARQLGSTWSGVDQIIRRSGVSMGFLSGETEEATGRLTDQERALEDYRTALENLLELNPETKSFRENQKQLAEALSAFNDAQAAVARGELGPEALAEAEAAYDAAVAGINRQTDAYKEQQRAIKSARDEERRRQEQIQKITDDLLFQLDQLDRSEREQAIQSVLRSAPGASPEQQQQLGVLAGAVFDAEQAEEQKQALRDLQSELDKILNTPVSREQFILNEAISDGVDLATEFGQEYARIQGQIFDATAAIEAQKLRQEELRDLIDVTRNIEAERNSLVQELNQAIEDGNGAQAEALRARIAETTQQLIQSRDAAIALATALGDVKALTALQKINVEYKEAEKNLITLGEFNRQFAQGFASAFGSVGNLLGEYIDGTQKLGEGLVAVRDAFRSFASDFLARIADMILQQLIFNALQNSGLFGGTVGGINALVRHGGGIVGGASGRMVNPALFANALRYHSGGIAGMRPGEIPAILEQGEEILTRDDPRHMFNGGGQAAGGVKIVNTIDPAEFISQGLSSAPGERAFLNFIRSNKSAVKAAMG